MATCVTIDTISGTFLSVFKLTNRVRMLNVQFWTLVKIWHRNKNKYVKRVRHGLHIFKIWSKFLSLFMIVCNACLSFPSLFILVSLWFIIISLFFFSVLINYFFRFPFRTSWNHVCFVLVYIIAKFLLLMAMLIARSALWPKLGHQCKVILLLTKRQSRVKDFLLTQLNINVTATVFVQQDNFIQTHDRLNHTFRILHDKWKISKSTCNIHI